MIDIVKCLLDKEDALLGKGISIENIHIAETKLNTVFADDYKQYLNKFGLAAYDGHELTGLGEIDRLDVVSVTLEKRKDVSDIPERWYVIEDACIDGIVIWQNNNGEIYQSIPGGETIKICNSLLDYIKKY